MRKECPCCDSDYFYHASAFGLAAKVLRPANSFITTKATTTLSSMGGHSSDHAEDFQIDGPVSFRAAHVEVGGSYDECHQAHTSFASAVVEGLNIHNIITADKVVSRLSIKYPGEGSDLSEPSISPIGSYFENLRIAGHKIDVNINTALFHKHDTYSGFCNRYTSSDEMDPWLHWSKLESLKPNDLKRLETQHHSMTGMYSRFQEWKANSRQSKQAKKSKKSTGKTNQQHAPEVFWCSLANNLDLTDQVTGSSGLRNFGAIICIPNFGVVHLAELVIEKRFRRFHMLRVEMGSPVASRIDTTGTTGSGGSPFPFRGTTGTIPSGGSSFSIKTPVKTRDTTGTMPSGGSSFP
jgi:hypothetical protein